MISAAGVDGSSSGESSTGGDDPCCPTPAASQRPSPSPATSRRRGSDHTDGGGGDQNWEISSSKIVSAPGDEGDDTYDDLPEDGAAVANDEEGETHRRLKQTSSTAGLVKRSRKTFKKKNLRQKLKSNLQHAPKVVHEPQQGSGGVGGQQAAEEKNIAGKSSTKAESRKDGGSSSSSSSMGHFVCSICLKVSHVYISDFF